MNLNNLSNMINIIKTYLKVNLVYILTDYSKLKYNVLILLYKNFYIKKIFIFKENKKFFILLELFYSNNNSSIQNIKLISKPSLRIYSNFKNLPILMNGLGLYIISTNLGVLTNYFAKFLGVGGELICYVF